MCTRGSATAVRTASFPRRRRLTQSGEFKRVFAGASRSSDRFFTVLARENDNHIARLGLTISKRAARRAVDRNRLKRLAREAFRHQASLPALDFVVLAKPGAAGTDSRTLRSSLDRHFARLGRRADGKR